MSNGTTQTRHRIPLDQARRMARKFQDLRQNIGIPGQPVADLLPISETFSRDAFDALLAQPGCAGVRIYYGMDDQFKVHAIVMGVDASDRDIISSAATSSTTTATTATATTETTTTGTTTTDTTTTTDGVIIEDARRCPPDCSTTSGFNP
jgi:hypothetical protein